MLQRPLPGRVAGLLLCLLAALGAVRASAQAGLGRFAGSGGPSELAAVGPEVLFLSSEAGASTLWKSDGTISGTREIIRLEGYSTARIIECFQDAVFFVTGFGMRYGAGGGESYLTLWVTDGTEGKTVELATGSAPYYSSDVPQGIRQPDPGSVGFQVIGGDGLYFFVRSQTGLDGDHPRAEIFCCRLSGEPPVPVFAAQGRAHIPLLAVDRGRLYFTTGSEIWASNGGPAVRVLEYNPSWSYLYGARELQIEDRHFHAKSDPVHGTELWLRRGGTDSLVRDINSGTNSSDPSSFARLGSLLVFSADTVEHGREPWVSDGTEAGTKMLLDIAPGGEDSSPDFFAPVDGALLFVTRYLQLWRTDGTPEGTAMISPSLSRSAKSRREAPDLSELPEVGHPSGSSVIALTPVGDLLFYLVTTFTETEHRGDTRVAWERLARTELWRTDGTPSGSMALKVWQRTHVDTYELEDPFEPDDRHQQIP
jgi:ELWxxDGT repeat protein